MLFPVRLVAASACVVSAGGSDAIAWLVASYQSCDAARVSRLTSVARSSVADWLREAAPDMTNLQQNCTFVTQFNLFHVIARQMAC